ncbi:hypothetical protein SHKM778_16710 [Streptomyces sp. KM77-8]|uniref:Uncharacterized protein n=1 Tax=Streptomyces haneummycinicus TaxID=3074435 RepID=A0AAT9HDA3_9ACTN
MRGAGTDGPGGGEAVDEEEASAVFRVRVRVGQYGLTRARVGDGEPVVAVGRPQDEFDEVLVLPAASVTNGVGDQFGGQEAEVVTEMGAEDARQRFRDSVAGSSYGGRVGGKMPVGGYEGISGMANSSGCV